METPKPTLIVSAPAYSSVHQKRWARHVKTILAIPIEEELKIRKVLANHRRRQTIKLGERDEDPNPYEPTYIFYCLETPRVR